MKKNKIIIVFTVLIVLIIAGITTYRLLSDDTRLTVEERQWLDSNKNNVISVNVINDLNVFGNSGSGVYFDYLNSLKENYNIEINPVVFSSLESTGGISFGYSFDNDNYNVFYEDEFVLIGKKQELITNINSINSSKIGTLKEYQDYVSKYLNIDNNNYIVADNKENLIKSLTEKNEVNYILVPKIMYLNIVLSNDLHINYHVSDAKVYYGFNNDSSELASIMNKHLAVWMNKEFLNSLNENELNLFTKDLNISSKDIDSLRANTYTYGLLNNDPYEIMSSGSIGGINAIYLKKFADLLDIKIDFNKYNNIEKLQRAIDNKKIDIYFDYYKNESDYEAIPSNIIIPLAVIAHESDNEIVNSLNSLNKKVVYVEENSKIYDYLKNNSKLNIKTYKTNKEFKQIVNDKSIIILDTNKFESYKNNILIDYSIRYTENINSSFKFRTKINNSFNKLFGYYLETLDNNTMRYDGINNYIETKKNGTLIGTLAKYILILLLGFIIISYLVYKKSKKIKIAKKIKKEDKMRFIDQLTSLKNRNYLTENLENWNKNTIYPQAVIVLDLNKLQDINDTLGYEKGDSQILAAANILVKTQLDNTDIIRTDGNEFLIYLVGYDVKQVTSYIHKLNKEFKKLPFDYGVAVGHSMILDDVKSIEDATNEAVEQVKLQKEANKDA